MEIIFGFLVAFAVSLSIRFYHRYFADEGARHKPFEQWCRSGQVVVALRCRPDTAIDIYEIVRRQIEPWGFFLNSQGRFPWQHYLVEVDARRANDEVIVFHVTACRALKVSDKPRELSASLTEIGRAAGDRIEEIWLHGQLHAINRVISMDRSSAAWIGDFDESGALDVEAMIGQPPWLVEALSKAA